MHQILKPADKKKPMIPFNLQESVVLLAKTPLVLQSLVMGLPDAWIYTNEGGSTWSPYAVVGHLVHGEKTDWIPRVRIILSASENKTFEPFDRFAMLERDQTIPVEELLNEFKALRAKNLLDLERLQLKPEDMARTGLHPALGLVTLSQLMASWVVHDLSHLAQVSRVLAFQYKEAVGPWKEYMGVYQWQK